MKTIMEDKEMALLRDIVKLTFLCSDVKAIHISIARKEDLWFPTKDKDIGK